MPDFRLACQSITWDPDRVPLRDHLIGEIAAAGYEGWESGAPFLDLEQPEALKHTIDSVGLKLIAIHTGYNPLLAIDSRGALEQILAFAQVTETEFVVLSGAADTAGLGGQIAGINAAARKCADAGVQLCYHNHWWEIAGEAEVLRAIIAGTDPQLVQFCPDIGWVRKTTPRVTETLELMRGRIRMAHFKDYVDDDPQTRDNETEFGQGIVDFPQALRFLQGLELEKMWLVAEQWKSAVTHLPPEASIRANLTFLREQIAGL